MSNRSGFPIWYELRTADPGAAKSFYDVVLGWAVDPQPSGEMDYRMIAAGEGLVGGVMRLTDEMIAGGVHPGWMFYIGVEDLDRTVEEIISAGGRVIVEPWTIPGIGRMAVIADPQGIPFYIMRGESEGESTAFDPTGIGKCGWNELSTPDQEGALAFYARVFGWSLADRMPIGELGDYVFANVGGSRIGAVMPHPPEGPPPGWRFYFRVADVDKVAALVPGHGGAVRLGPMDVPNGDRIIIATDPEGVMFCAIATPERARA